LKPRVPTIKFQRRKLWAESCWDCATGGKQIAPMFDPEMFRIRPKRIYSWGINSNDPFKPSARSVG
jgi:hypothetical protein